MELRTFDPSTAEAGAMKFSHNLELGVLIAVKARGKTTWEIRVVTGRVTGIDRDWEPIDEMQSTLLYMHAWDEAPVLGGRRSRMDPNEIVFSFGSVSAPQEAADILSEAKAYPGWEFALDEAPDESTEDES